MAQYTAAGGVTAAAAPFFLVGCERSGTTLLRLMLNAHPDVAIPPESYFIHDLWGVYPSTAAYPETVRPKILHVLFEGACRATLVGWGLDLPDVQRALQQHPRLDHATVITELFCAYARRDGKPRWGDKTPAYVESIGILAAIFPEARVVHLIRDGRAVCESVLRQRFGPETPLEAGLMWSRRVGRGRRAGRKLPADRYLEVFYRPLVTDPERVLRQVCGFLGLAFDPAMLHHDETLALVPSSERDGRHDNALKPVTPELLEHWKDRLSDSQRRLIEAVAGRTLRECGYAVEQDARQHVYGVTALAWRFTRFLVRLPGKVARWVGKYLSGERSLRTDFLLLQAWWDVVPLQPSPAVARTPHRSPRLAVRLAGAAAALLLALSVSPMAALWLPGSWKQHTYQEISFQLIAREELSRAESPEATVQAAISYTQRQLWRMARAHPSSSQPFDYLVAGVGRRTSTARVFCQLLAAHGLHTRFVVLKDGRGGSPHTVAEVQLRGKWRPVDPFFNVIYASDTGEWPSLEEVTPVFVDRLPRVVLLRATTSDWDDTISSLARRTFPLPQRPQRSKDFLSGKSVFDRVTDAYVAWFGRRFAYWYQDRFLQQQLAVLRDPTERVWYQARSYHLYGRWEEAERLYRRLLVQGPPVGYRERVVLFLSRLLIRQERFAEAREVLEQFVGQRSGVQWVYFQLALCYEGLGDRAAAIRSLRHYQQLHGNRFALEASRHLQRLQQQI